MNDCVKMTWDSTSNSFRIECPKNSIKMERYLESITDNHKLNYLDVRTGLNKSTDFIDFLESIGYDPDSFEVSIKKKTYTHEEAIDRRKELNTELLSINKTLSLLDNDSLLNDVTIPLRRICEDKKAVVIDKLMYVDKFIIKDENGNGY